MGRCENVLARRCGWLLRKNRRAIRMAATSRPAVSPSHMPRGPPFGQPQPRAYRHANAPIRQHRQPHRYAGVFQATQRAGRHHLHAIGQLKQRGIQQQAAQRDDGGVGARRAGDGDDPATWCWRTLLACTWPRSALRKRHAAHLVHRRAPVHALPARSLASAIPNGSMKHKVATFSAT